MGKKIVGIDLGTTYSAIAYVNDDLDTEVIPNSDGKTTTPSVVLFENGEIIVGQAALNQYITNEENVSRWIKLAMDDPDYRFKDLTPVEISAEILKSLKADAERRLGEGVDEALITCPAYFNAVAIENTKLAGEQAGFKVREIVKEPTAAAICYGIEHLNKGDKLLVCDLGGGTFDATILTIDDEGVFQPLATKGSPEMGGYHWTLDLQALVVDVIKDRHKNEDPLNDLVAGQILFEECEKAKRAFKDLSEVTISFPFKGELEQVTVSRDEFEKLTEWRMQNLVTWAEQALEKAGLKWEDINTILLVGGSSRLRRMSLALEEASGITPVRSSNPDLMVVEGAAIMASGKVRTRKKKGALQDSKTGGLVESIEYGRIIPRSLGTRCIIFENGEPRITTAELIHHSTEAPVSCSDDFKIASDGQEYFDVPVVEFEDDDVFVVINNWRFDCHPDSKRGDEIIVTFNYDKSAIIEVEALDTVRNEKLSFERRPYEEPDPNEMPVLSLKPFWLVFAIDVSWSMDGEKLTNSKQALSSNAGDLLKISNRDCRIGIVSFSTVAKPVCNPTNDLSQIVACAESMEVEGTTAMDDGIRLAVDMVMGAPADFVRTVVMLTDGMPDSNRRDNTLKVVADARSKGVNLKILGIGSDEIDSDYLTALTPESFVIESGAGIQDGLGHLMKDFYESTRA